MRHSTSESYPDSKPYPYCGVVYDGRIILGGLTGKSMSDSGYDGRGEQILTSSTLVLFGIIDSPLSLCLDTILLPYDIYRVTTSEKQE